MKKIILFLALILASYSTPVVEENIAIVDSTAVECVDTCAKTTQTCSVTCDSTKVDTVKVK